MNGSKLRWALCSLLAVSVLQAGEADELLSALKRKSLALQHEKNRADSGELEFSWVNAVTLSYTDSRSEQFDTTQRRREFAIVVDQPIFKSGGIWYAVKYAKATRHVGDLLIETQRRQLIKQVVATLFNFKKNAYQIEKQKLMIENDRLDIERKKEQYLSGDLDSGFLDQAILKKNQDTLNLYVLEDTKAQLQKRFDDLSDADPSTIKLPRFTLMDKETFLKNHIDLARQKEEIDQKNYFNTMTWARYMPTLSVQASYVKPYENNYFFSGGNVYDLTDDYYTYGFRLSMPLDIKSYYTIESTKVDYLNAKVKLSDSRREADNTYVATLKRLKVLDRMIELSKSDEVLYSSLVKSTKEKVDAGEMTMYDLQTMQNSKRIRQLDQKIFDLDKQLVLLDLYEKSYESVGK
ncbi:TolC family protein [Hydrogenimonas urashimensis]|uniref:TolC family protein n=1 Tax=Hydrogenimonas urashimensis TaxID=2740515 RepID=UPI0019161EDE|nr:TolC family protein [Hydrogenimonas urashimensis]